MDSAGRAYEVEDRGGKSFLVIARSVGEALAAIDRRNKDTQKSSYAEIVSIKELPHTVVMVAPVRTI